MKKTLTEKATGLFLLAVGTIGAFLVSEQVITGEQLMEVQGVVGMGLAGGSLSFATIIYAIKVLVPKNMLANVIEKVGQEKIDDTFAKVDEGYALIKEVYGELKLVKDELALMREEKEALKQDLGL
jgi:hypothetical protein